MFDNISMAGFIAFALILLFFIIRITVRKINIFAKPPINPFAFIVAKISAFTSCLFIPLGRIFPELKLYSLPGIMYLFGLCMFFTGTIFAIIDG